ncbi:MAG: tripartite tricarboxylate transporter substrate binding protein [Beijerinckiaceae bacterium]|nr:tripartite tricarboxylate transporter substrate binding protein [Beijerinckiaceae bacterium]
MSPAALAQQYPTRTVRVIVPFTVGTGYDLIARVVANGLQARFDKPFVVENAIGAGSLVGAGQLARAAPDGYTFGMIGEGTTAAAMLMPATKLDPVADFKPITVAGFGTLLLLSGKDSGIRDVNTLVEKARTSPQPLSYGSPGIGQTQHLRMEILKENGKFPMTHIPYKGSAPALSALMNGEVAAALTPIHQVTAHLANGNLNALAVLAEERDPRAPNVPTLKELGIQGLDTRMWYAFVAPAKTPQAIIDVLQAEITAVLAEPAARKQLEATGLQIAPTTPERALEIMKAEVIVARKIIEAANIKMD